jgi:hypothetical protein
MIESAVLGGEARGLEHITMLDTESTGPVDGCELTVPTLSSLIGLLGMRYRQPPESKIVCVWRRRGEECQLLCNDRGPYHWTTEPKGMLRCPFDSEPLYL